jgi:hypothetical protein
MTIQIRPTQIQFADGSIQTTAASVDPAWANIRDRPGRGGTSAGPNDAFHYAGLISNLPFNNGGTGNCGNIPYGYETKFRLKNSQVTANSTLGNDWYMYYWLINCHDCTNCTDCIGDSQPNCF